MVKPIGEKLHKSAFTIFIVPPNCELVLSRAWVLAVAVAGTAAGTYFSDTGVADESQTLWVLQTSRHSKKGNLTERKRPGVPWTRCSSVPTSAAAAFALAAAPKPLALLPFK